MVSGWDSRGRCHSEETRRTAVCLRWWISAHSRAESTPCKLLMREGMRKQRSLWPASGMGRVAVFGLRKPEGRLYHVYLTRASIVITGGTLWRRLAVALGWNAPQSRSASILGLHWEAAAASGPNFTYCCCERLSA